MKKNKKRKIKKEYVAGWLMGGLPVVGFVLFGAIPIVYSFFLSFVRLNSYDVTKAVWVGLENYEFVLQDARFLKAIGNTLLFLISVPVNMALSLGMALLINKNIKGVKVFRTILFAKVGHAGFYANGANAVFTNYSYTTLKKDDSSSSEKDLLKQVFGDKKTITISDVKGMSQGLDMTKKDEGIIKATESGKQEVWFNAGKADKYIVKVTVSDVSALNDEWPSVGLLVGDDGLNNGVRLQLFTGYNGEGMKHLFKVYNLQMAEPTLDNTYHELAGKSGVETAEGVELMVVRDGKKFDFYIAGKLVYSGESDLLANAGHAGFYSNGAKAVFSNYSYTALSNVPKTGDTSEGFVFAAMASISLVVIGVYVVNAKKKQYN